MLMFKVWKVKITWSGLSLYSLLPTNCILYVPQHQLHREDNNGVVFVFVCSGESVEENANVVVRLLIRRPECFGPALRGEGGNGLLAAIEEAIKISEDPARDGPSVKKDRRFPMYISFYFLYNFTVPCPCLKINSCVSVKCFQVWRRRATRGEQSSSGKRHHVLLRRSHRPAGTLRSRNARKCLL